MNFVDDQDEPIVKFSFLKDRVEFLFIPGHGVEQAIRQMQLVGQHRGQRRFARPRRPVKDHGKQPALLDAAPDHLSRTDEMLLPDHLV